MHWVYLPSRDMYINLAQLVYVDVYEGYSRIALTSMGADEEETFSYSDTFELRGADEQVLRAAVERFVKSGN